MDNAKPEMAIPGVMDEQALFDPEEPGIFDELDEVAERAADAEAEADAAAGRTISHEAMKRWLSTWGTDTPLPPPECGC